MLDMSDQHQQKLKYLRESVESALELVPKDKWPDVEKLVQFRIKSFGNPDQFPEWKGYRLNFSFNVRTAEYTYNKFEPRSSDVLVATYVKTGTTWLTEIVRNIFYVNNPDLLAKERKIHQFYRYLSKGPVEKYQVLENVQLPRLCLGTHLPASLINFDKFRRCGTKILYVIRNPKDQAVSIYNFMMGFQFTKIEKWRDVFPGDEKTFYDLYLTGKVPRFSKDGEGYLEHVKEWYAHRHDPNVMFVAYEEMKQDIRREVRRVANFIGVRLSEEEVDKICDNSSFRSMKREAAKLEQEKEMSAPSPLFHRGQVGGWKNHLTVAQSELIDANVERILGDTDIKFIYELDEQKSCTF